MIYCIFVSQFQSKFIAFLYNKSKKNIIFHYLNANIFELLAFFICLQRNRLEVFFPNKCDDENVEEPNFFLFPVIF
jgi:hypothetical protein